MALAAAAYETCGPTGLTMFVGQAIGSVLLLEVVTFLPALSHAT